jgi:uncharacterized protein
VFRKAIENADIRSGLWAGGYSRLGTILGEAECEQVRSLYDTPELFRSQVDMARYRFGRGEYKYFTYPLPDVVAELREALYGCLVDAANEWMAALGLAGDFPGELGCFLARCAAQGQSRPTPLLLHYVAGDFNCLHQDLYGDVVFPFQVIFGLSKPDREFTGGELLLVEQQPRAQSIGHAIRIEQGEAVVITTRYKPVKGSRGYYRTNLRHGVSPVLTGERFTLGIIFHDAA